MTTPGRGGEGYCGCRYDATDGGVPSPHLESRYPTYRSCWSGHRWDEGGWDGANRYGRRGQWRERQTSKTEKIGKLKLNKEEKDDVATKKEQRRSALKQGSAAVPLPTLRPPAPAYKYERVFYEAGLELKGENKYGAYVKQIGSLLENIQLVDPSAILHAAVETDSTKPIGKKEELSNNMTIFLVYPPVGKNQNAFKQKKNNNKKKGRHGKDEPELLDPSVYPTLVFSSDVDPETIVLRMMHEFCCVGGFYFWKKQLQCMERTVTPLHHFLSVHFQRYCYPPR